MPGRADALRALALVIPAYQAAATVGEVATRARRVLPGARCYVVDDGSEEGTAAAARAAGADVLTHAINCGKGAALATGIARAVADGAETLVTLDADGQHLPEEIPKLIEPIARGAADLVLGARPRSGRMPLGRRFTNWLSGALASRLGVPVPDAQTGFRAFTRALALAVQPPESRYDYETAFLLAALAAGYRVASVAVATVYNGERSHFRYLADTWRLARVFSRFGRRIVLGAEGEGGSGRSA